MHDEIEEINIAQTRSKELVSSFANPNTQTPTRKTTSINKLSSNSNKIVQTKLLEYDLVEDMKKSGADISLYELSKLTHQKNKLFGALEASSTNNHTRNIINYFSKKVAHIEETLIRDKPTLHTLPFLLTFEIYNPNVHNCMVDSCNSSNIMPTIVAKKLNLEPQKSSTQII